jgi:hypothetical protein
MKKLRFEIVVMVRGKLPEELFVEHVIREVPPECRKKLTASERREATRRRIAFHFPKSDE